MADLPSPRLQIDRPSFSHVGVDYFGPYQVKQRRSMVKRYGCVFSCLTVRAVHIEISHALTTDSFLCTLRRFTVSLDEESLSKFIATVAPISLEVQEH